MVLNPIDSTAFDISRFNAAANNKFETREDVAEAVRQMFRPLLSHFSPGKSRVQFDSSGATFDRASADLEAFSRPLFGLAPLAAGGGAFDHWQDLREGLANGVDPQHAEFWGIVESSDQRQVEMAALSFGILFASKELYEPLNEQAKHNLGNYLLHARGTKHHSNNHKFFRIITDLALDKIGVAYDRSMTEDYLQDMESLYVGDGWYRDGDDSNDTRRIDYYNPFAMHYYGLVYALVRPEDKRRADFFKKNAVDFAKHYQHWFADTGANIPYGRSLIYRHAVGAYWGALALCNLEALPWGVMKGIYLRNLRWWATQPISRMDDGVLSVGYSYPNQFMSERYNSTGSPYWSMKVFLPLALPADHPFWTAEELPIDRPEIASSSISGMVFSHHPNHTVLLASGPETCQAMRFVPEKYLKFAYSTRFGFSIESDHRHFDMAVLDSMIGFSDDGLHFRVREHISDARLLNDNILYSVWNPWTDVKVETWLIPKGKWHLRAHRVTSEKDLSSIEGGFAAPRLDFNQDERTVETNTRCYVKCALGDFSGIVDLSDNARQARVHVPHGNTSLMFPRTYVPQLVGPVSAGKPVVFACAVIAGPDSSYAEDWKNTPIIPSIEELDQILHSGVEMKIIRHYDGVSYKRHH
jgi:hypothetical protein